jgi:hypothetical protein
MAMVYGCRVPLFGQEWEHHILLLLTILCLDWDMIATYNWGSTALALLYRVLCDDCMRTSDNTNLGGCAYLLQI